MKFLLRKLPNDSALLAILIALSAFAGQSFLYSGHPTTGDCWAHLARTQVVYNSLSSFQIPYWDFSIYYGYPFLKFYGPLYYYLAAFFSFISGGNIIWGTKLLLFVSHIASAISMYYFAKKILNNNWAAFTAGLAYALSFWHLFHLLAMARYPVALIYALTPICFLCTLKFVESQNINRGVVLGLVVAMLFLTHPFFAAFSILFSLILILPMIRELKFKHSLWAIVATLGFCGFFIVPFIIEGPKYLNPFSVENFNSVNLWALLRWSNDINATGNWYTGEYIGISIVLLALTGIAKTIKDNGKFKLPIILILVLSALFVFGFGLPVFRYFYQLHGAPPKRFIIFMIMILSLMAGNGYLFLAEYVKKKKELLLIFVGIIFIDLAPTCIQFQWYRPFQQAVRYRDLIYQNVKPGAPIADLGSYTNDTWAYVRAGFSPGAQTLYSQNPSPFGYYFQFAPKNSLYTYPWLNLVAMNSNRVETDSLFLRNRKILELLNIKYIAVEDKEKGVGMRGFQALINILISGAIKPWISSKTTLDGQYCCAADYIILLDSTKINIDSAMAQCLWIADTDSESIDNFIPAKPNVAQFELKQNTAQIIVETQSPCFARIPLSYYPGIKIYINGARCPKVYESADHFMIVQLDKGVSKIDVIPTRSKIEIASLFLSGICLAAVSVVLYRERKSRKTKSL